MINTVSKKKVMVVDDDPPTTDFLKTLLTMRGYAPICAYSGQECLRKLEKETPDLILLDIVMQDMSGWDVLDKLREDERYDKIPIIVVSAKSRAVDIVRAIKFYEAKDYVAKPFSNEKLICKIRKAIGD